mmetsp:Transcript_20816/g.46139  ORF Transcript_20816/g.46139 Transcript_20816/m.46139 type:complete len:269 (+) Transcript_20816:1106-1912(+)
MAGDRRRRRGAGERRPQAGRRRLPEGGRRLRARGRRLQGDGGHPEGRHQGQARRLPRLGVAAPLRQPGGDDDLQRRGQPGVDVGEGHGPALQQARPLPLDRHVLGAQRPPPQGLRHGQLEPAVLLQGRELPQLARALHQRRRIRQGPRRGLPPPLRRGEQEPAVRDGRPRGHERPEGRGSRQRGGRVHVLLRADAAAHLRAGAAGHAVQGACQPLLLRGLRRLQQHVDRGGPRADLAHRRQQPAVRDGRRVQDGAEPPHLHRGLEEGR